HYLLAKVLTIRGTQAKQQQARLAAWEQARRHITFLESSDNEFSSRALALKIGILKEEGAFTKPLAQHRGFDELYLRALWEDQELKKQEDEGKRAEMQKTVAGALEKALKLVGPRSTVPQKDVYNAKYMLTGYYLSLGAYENAARVGKEFAMKSPQASQAP